MYNNGYLNKLKAALNSTSSYDNKSNKKRKRCVAYAEINGRKYFAVSGASLDYDDVYRINGWKQTNDFILFKFKLKNFIDKDAYVVSLNSKCQTQFISYEPAVPIGKKVCLKSYMESYYNGRIRDAARLFSCVERKLLFCTQEKIKNCTIYVAKEPCFLCRPFIKGTYHVYYLN